MAGCYAILKESMESLPQAEQRVALFILSNPEKVMNQSIGELAARCSTSKTTIMRLCQGLGFNGFKDFVKSLVADIALGQTENVGYTDLHPLDDIQTTIQSVSSNNILSIENTLKVLDPKEVERAVEAIINAKRIDFYGVGSSGIIALDAQSKFLRISKNCHAFTDAHQQLFSAASLQPNDVAVLISYSGETIDILDTLSTVKAAGATTIGITRYAKNSLSSRVDIKLFTTSTETSFRSGAMASRIVQLNVIDIIFSAVAGRTYDDIKKYLDSTRIAMDKKKFRVVN
ncbi:MAG: MurR/RpiR family transcriptional regulator [Treponemataceae bacterium]